MLESPAEISTTGIKIIITSSPLKIELRQAESFQHWLVMYFLKYVFWIIFNPKKVTACSFKLSNLVYILSQLLMRVKWKSDCTKKKRKEKKK